MCAVYDTLSPPQFILNQVHDAQICDAHIYSGEPQHTRFCREISFDANYALWIHYFQLFSATSTVKMPVFMKNYKFCWQNCKKNDVYVAKICNGKIRCFCRENLQTRALR